MKYYFTALLFLIHISVFGQLVAHFPFTTCANVTDATGVNPDAFPQGFADPRPCACGVQDSALIFNGINNRLLLVGNYDNYFDTDNFSISINFKQTNTLGNKVLFSKRDSCNDQRGIYLKYTAASNVLTAFVGENSSKRVLLSGKLDFSRCWHHIVLVRNLNRVSLYADGVLLDEENTTSTINCKNEAIFTIGYGPCADVTDFPFAGFIDDIRVYRSALKFDDIKSINFQTDLIENKNDTLVIEGSSFDVRTTATCANQFNWTPVDPMFGIDDVNDPNTTITPPATQTYRLDFIHADGCIAWDTLRVVVVDPDSLNCDDIFLPKAFTPNNDGLNDKYGISNPFAIVNLISFEILDRWGGRMFYTEDPFQTWDGTFNGQEVNPGVCVYRIRYLCRGEEKIKLGSFTVLK